jgi:hypothetical protein
MSGNSVIYGTRPGRSLAAVTVISATKNTLHVSAHYRLTWGLKPSDCTVVNLTWRQREETSA